MWNANLPEAVNGTLHGVFGDKANETPDKLAVDAWDAGFTYAELDRASNRWEAISFTMNASNQAC